ncbi:MAG: GNAT family N-acetyltransferase [Campylobacter sp.]|nr:GNAT family N-acetyltransferase [Campylobacter sp.]
MISKATPQDADKCIALLKLAIEDAAYHLSACIDEAKSDEILHEYFLCEKNRLSYNNVYVYKDKGEILAAACAYSGDEVALLDESIKASFVKRNLKFNLSSECEVGEFYIDSIAVCKAYRSQGIATKLINYLCELAKEKGFDKISLLVDSTKPHVQNFYEKLGFHFNKEKLLYKHKYYHLIKDL